MHAAFDLGLADGAIDRIVKIRMRTEGLCQGHVHDVFHSPLLSGALRLPNVAGMIRQDLAQPIRSKPRYDVPNRPISWDVSWGRIR